MLSGPIDGIDRETQTVPNRNAVLRADELPSTESRPASPTGSGPHDGDRRLHQTLRLMAARICRLVYVREAHVWYRLDLGIHNPSRLRTPGLKAIRAQESDLALLAQLSPLSRRLARRRWAQGGHLWIVLQSGRAVFACWIFRKRAPASCSPHGWLELPAGTVAAVDSVVRPRRRVVAVAPEAWGEIVAILARESIGAIVTPIDESDLPHRRTVEQIGFRAFASMRVLRFGGRAHVGLRLHEAARSQSFIWHPHR